MKGKRWELPQRFRTIYWQNFALTASIVMLTLALLGASFFALSYAYAADERSDEMAQKASVVARLVASYASSGDVRDMREMAGVAASMTDVDFLVCSTEGSVLLTTDENLVDHVLTVPSDVMETALSGERYSARTTLGGIYEGKRFVVGVPIESDIWTVGAVFAVTETGRLTTMWRAFFAMFLMTSVIVLLLSFVASAWVSMRQSRPIREMAAATRAFAEGNFDTRMHDYGAGEIGELASAFNAMADSLQETERQRREFIANISHELKTPMTSIAGYTDGILDGTIPPEKEKEYLHIISDESRRLSRLVRRMLEVSQLQSRDVMRLRRVREHAAGAYLNGKEDHRPRAGRGGRHPRRAGHRARRQRSHHASHLQPAGERDEVRPRGLDALPRSRGDERQGRRLRAQRGRHHPRRGDPAAL